MKKPRINSELKIIDEWTDLFKNKHYLLVEIKDNFILIEVELNWKEIPEP